VRIVDLGSFAKAAEDLGVTASALSKTLSRLENRLGVRLLTRTTRRLALTTEGELYLARARNILVLIEAAETEASEGGAYPQGLLRINTGTAVGIRLSDRIVPEFLARFPGVSIELMITDRIVDPIAEHLDVALRTGPLADSTLIARKLRDLRRVVCAAPAYLERHGVPARPADLANHNCLRLSTQAQFSAWPFAAGEGVNALHVGGNFSCDNVGLLVSLALQGHGIIRLADFLVGKYLRDGRLIELLVDTNMAEPLPLWAIMPPGRNRLPRVRAFVDFLAERLAPE
jgi:DNA-binding transcriptional LysR family regulator